MSNNKSSVTELYNKMMQYVPIEYHELVREEIPLGQYKAMHKEEIKQAIMFGDCRGQISTYATSEQYYNETFGGNNEQQ